LSQTLLSVKNDSGEEIFTGEGELYIGECVFVCTFILQCSFNCWTYNEVEGDVVGWLPKTYKRGNTKVSDDVCKVWN